MKRDQARFEVFSGHLASWNALFTRAAAFATEIGPGRVISVSHSEDELKGVVTVWYWSAEADDAPPEGDPADDFIRDDEDAVEWKPGQEREPL
jgi:hypothetical protein